MLEMMDYFEMKGVENGVGMNKGGSTEAEGLRIPMTHAHHSSSIGEADGTIVYTGEPAGLVNADDGRHRSRARPPAPGRSRGRCRAS